MAEDSVVAAHLAAPASRESAPDGAAIAAGEKRWLAALLLALLGARVWCAWKIDFTSDESQHLHVVWAWANHLWPYSPVPSLPYRDVFDNHTPLFHLLCAPLFRLFGETAQVMIYMRLAMIPLFAASLWLVARIGAALFSRRAGWWAAVFAGWFPFLLLKTVEFRTDEMWMTAWLGVIALAVGGPLTARRMFALGLALGTAFAVSMKTVPLTLALLLAALAVGILGGGWRTRAALAGGGAALAGLLVVPGAVIAYFGAQHALGEFYYGVITHNLMPAKPHVRHLAPCFWLLSAVPLGFAARWILRRPAPPAQGFRRALLLLASGLYLTLLRSFWPLLTPQDYLPVAPLFIVLITPLVLALGVRWPRLPRLAVALAVVAGEAAVAGKLARRRAPSGIDLAQIAEVLRFTDPADYVMDAKAGAIFRRRPFFYALEDLTKRRIRRGLIADDIIERMIATRTCMAADGRLDGRELDFLRANYLPAEGRFAIAGQRLHPAEDGRAAFAIKIATSYAVVTPRGAASGKLDGQPYAGKVFLDAGPHEFVSDLPSVPLNLVWAQALERGFQSDFSAKTETEAP